jgi:hypothetical protein
LVFCASLPVDKVDLWRGDDARVGEGLWVYIPLI